MLAAMTVSEEVKRKEAERKEKEEEALSVFFSGPLGGEISPPKFDISPPNTNKFKRPAGCFSYFLSPQKQFPPP